jgi:tetratricopeptide (TPR) repeat protein
MFSLFIAGSTMLRRGIFLGALIAPAVLQASPTKQEQAAAYFSAAEIFFQAEQYEKALESYIESYKLSNFPELLFNIGQCYRALARHSDALTSYRNYLSAVPNSPIKKDVDQWIKELEPLAAKEAAEKEAAQNNQSESLPEKAPEPVTPITTEPIPVSNNKKFLLPAGLVVSGIGMATGAILIEKNIQETKIRTNAAAAGKLALAIGADAALLGAAVSFLFAMRPSEPRVSVSPVDQGAVITLRIGGAQ